MFLSKKFLLTPLLFVLGIFMLELINKLMVWFDNAGWLVNALTLGGFLVTLALLVWRLVKLMLSESTFRGVITKYVMDAWDSDSVKNISEIAIVDDNLSDFPISALKKAGYRVKTYTQINIGDIEKLSTYDLVFLDMYGIIKDDLKEGGLKLIGKLRAINPRQKICAVSSKTFDPTATEFFKKADDVEKKPISAQKCQEVIDELLREKLSPLGLAESLDDHTKSLSRIKKKIFLKRLTSAMTGCKDIDFILKDRLVKDRGVNFKSMIVDFCRLLRHEVN